MLVWSIFRDEKVIEKCVYRKHKNFCGEKLLSKQGRSNFMRQQFFGKKKGLLTLPEINIRFDMCCVCKYKLIQSIEKTSSAHFIEGSWVL